MKAQLLVPKRAETSRQDAVQKPRDCLRAIRAEYGEMPGLSLTRPQVARLLALAPCETDTLLDELVSAGFLRRTHKGCYVRADLFRN